MTDNPYDLSFSEDVLIEVDYDARAPGNWAIVHTHILREPGDPLGPMSYENNEVGLLHYTLKDIIPKQEPGIYVVEDVSADVHKGDGWLTDDDIHFTYHRVRPATDDEKALIQ